MYLTFCAGLLTLANFVPKDEEGSSCEDAREIKARFVSIEGNKLLVKNAAGDRYDLLLSSDAKFYRYQGSSRMMVNQEDLMEGDALLLTLDMKNRFDSQKVIEIVVLSPLVPTGPQE